MANRKGSTRGVGFKDITNMEFGCLRAVRIAGKNRHKQMLWECICDVSLGGCGNLTVAAGYHLRTGHTRSCGCFQAKRRIEANTTHGMSSTNMFRRWTSMKRRCLDQKEPAYIYYGARGIRVCERWMNLENFVADMGPPPGPGYSIERIDNDGDYEPGNCVWATDAEQRRNKRVTRRVTINGRTQCLADWIKESGLKSACVYRRLKRGWPMERALTQQVT